MTSSPGRRIVLVHRYFAPDTPPYAHMLHRIAAALANRGHQVTVLTCQPSYNRDVVSRAPRREVVDGFAVVRWPVLDDRRSRFRKTLNLVWFALRLVAARRTFARVDLVMAATTPPVVVAMVCSLVARSVGARFIYHKQDIYPEVAGCRGSLPRRLVVAALRSVDRRTDRRATVLVVLSQDMANTCRRRGSGHAPIVVLNNFDPWELGSASATGQRSRPSSPTERTLTVAFAGNLGRFQGLEHVERLVEATKDEPRIRWHFFGDGVLRVRIDRLGHGGAPVTLHGHQPASSVAEFLRREADLGIVSLNEGVINAAYPSKTMTYLRNGCPILALVEPASELGSMVETDGIGFVVGQDDVDAAAVRLRRLLEDPGFVDGARGRARQTYLDRFGMRRQLGRWVALVEEVTAS